MSLGKPILIGFISAIVVLLIIAESLGYGWYVAETNYRMLYTQYLNLQSRYSALQANYTNLQSQYNSLQSQYINLQSQYNSLQAQYNSLEGQYNSLESKYSELQSQCGVSGLLQLAVDRVYVFNYSGNVYYILDVVARYTGSGGLTLWESGFSLLGSNGIAYTATALPLDVSSLFPNALIISTNVGQYYTDFQVAFALPQGVRPVMLIYEYSGIEVNASLSNVPVTYISYYNTVDVYASPQISSNSLISPSPLIIGEAYLNGQEFTVALSITASPTTGVTINSISVTGANLVSVEPSLPLTVPAGNTVTITLTLQAPNYSYDGDLEITIS